MFSTVSTRPRIFLTDFSRFYSSLDVLDCIYFLVPDCLLTSFWPCLVLFACPQKLLTVFFNRFIYFKRTRLSSNVLNFLQTFLTITRLCDFLVFDRPRTFFIGYNHHHSFSDIFDSFQSFLLVLGCSRPFLVVFSRPWTFLYAIT